MQSDLLTAALRSVEKYLGLDKLYVLGTNCGNQLSCIFVILIYP